MFFYPEFGTIDFGFIIVVALLLLSQLRIKKK